MGRSESDKETGFFPKSANHNQYCHKNPVSGHPRSPGRTPTKKPGFFPNLRITTKYSHKNPVFDHPCSPGRTPTKKPGFFPNLRITTKYSHKNPVFDHPSTTDALRFIAKLRQSINQARQDQTITFFPILVKMIHPR